MISIKHKNGTFIFPVTPETFGPTGGDGKYDDVSVLKLGTVPFFDGTELAEYSWSSFFPAKVTGYTEGKRVPIPLMARDLLKKIKDTGEIVKLFIPDLGIQQNVQIRSFQYYQEKPGDIDYSIKIVEHRKIEIKTIEKKNGKETGKSNPSRPKPNKKPNNTGKTYKVKKGDTLSTIAEAYGIKHWKLLYEKNKKVIGNNPNLIKPGQVLKL